MERILVGIDFSECSLNALEHAISIAQRTGAKLLAVWVYNPDSSRQVLMHTEDEAGDMIFLARRKFQELEKHYRPLLKKGQFDYLIREGKVYRKILEQATSWEAELIVIGTHGASGFEEFWMGSNAFRLVSSSPCPIITIRGGINVDRNLRRIVLPIDSTLETRQKVPYTTELAKSFDAEVFVLAVYTSAIDQVVLSIQSYTEQVAKFLEDEGLKFQVEKVEAENITDATIAYAKEVDANLISIMTEQERTTANIILGPYAAQMVNHSPIPVLSVHPKEYLRTLSR